MDTTATYLPIILVTAWTAFLAVATLTTWCLLSCDEEDAYGYFGELTKDEINEKER